MHLDILMKLKDVDAEFAMNSRCLRRSVFWSRFKFLGQVLFVSYILVTTGLNFTRLAWMSYVTDAFHLPNLSHMF